jgi:hypothetical protein
MAFDREALYAQLMRFARGPAISQAAIIFHGLSTVQPALEVSA